jgi:hypothetical protein
VWIAHIGVEGDEIREIMYKTVDVAHKVVGVSAGELYPIADKDLVIGKGNPEIQGNAEEKSN